MIYIQLKTAIYCTFFSALFCMSLSAARYEIRVVYEPAYPDSQVQMEVVHPFNTSNSPYFGMQHGYSDCTTMWPGPDWGARGIDADNPEIDDDPYDGLITFSAAEITDPGSCLVRVKSTYKTAICIVYIVAWSGAEPCAYTNTLEEGTTWNVTELPCAKDIGLKVEKAKQKTTFSSRNFHKVKLQATFEALDAIPENNAYMRSSMIDQKWVSSLDPDDNKIKKDGLIAKYGKPKVCILKNKNKKKMKIKGICDIRLQDEAVPVFITFGEWSGFEIIHFDDKSKYKNK